MYVIGKSKVSKPSHTCICHKIEGDRFYMEMLLQPHNHHHYYISMENSMYQKHQREKSMKFMGFDVKTFFLRAHIRVDIFAIEYLWYKYDNSLYFTSSELYLILMFIFFFSLLPFSIPFIIESMYIIYSNVFSHLLGMYEYDMWTRSFQEAKIVWIDDWIEIEIERYVHDVS